MELAFMITTFNFSNEQEGDGGWYDGFEKWTYLPSNGRVYYGSELVPGHFTSTRLSPRMLSVDSCSGVLAGKSSPTFILVCYNLPLDWRVTH